MITIELTGSNTASALGVTHTEKRKGVIGPLCRKLIAAGLATEEDTVLVVRGTTPIFNERNITVYSGKDLYETDRGFEYAKYKPHPLFKKDDSGPKGGPKVDL